METFDALALALEQQTDALLKAIEQDDLALALHIADERQRLIEQLRSFSQRQEHIAALKQLADRMLTIDMTMLKFVESQKSEVELLLRRLNYGNKAVKLYMGVSEE